MTSIEQQGSQIDKPHPPRRLRRPNYNYVHRNLLPVQIHPLPPLIPHNPLSILAIALSYISQLLITPQKPSYNGYFSSATSSIHITDPKTIRALWEMGFFGRGSLSRSEPTWQQSQNEEGITAEENTNQRRNERRQQKRARARKEQQAIAQQLSEEAVPNGSVTSNIFSTNEPDFDGIADVLQSAHLSVNQAIASGEHLGTQSHGSVPTTSVGSKEAEIEPLGHSEPPANPMQLQIRSQIEGYEEWKKTVDASGLPTPPPTSTSSESSQHDIQPVQRLQKQKTVRFSPTIEAREFDLSSPVLSPIKSPGSSLPYVEEEDTPTSSQDKEHLHISLEEAFFLSYSLGVLKVYCDDSDAILSPINLLPLFRRHSYHPTRSLSIPAEPDDPFMLSYAVYHHYRSLGWVVRSGVKFGVDYLLYNRGPAFSHADFAVVIIPSYSEHQADTNTKQLAEVRERKKRTWWWLHGVNRVQAQVFKQLVLTYVKVPARLSKEDKGVESDIGKLFSRYKIRDVNVKRWTPNRARD